MYSCKAAVSHSFSHDETIICDGVLIPSRDNDSKETDFKNIGHHKTSCKIALLLDNGQMQFLDLSLQNGDIEDEGEFDIDLGSSISFPTEGVRRTSGADVDNQFSTATSLGEGSKLSYLHQSSLLLYKCSSSCVLALILDDTGKVVGSFELLPHTINTAMIGNENEGHSLRGPYTNWKELGIVERQGSFFYRVSLVARSAKGGQHKLLYLEFNHNCIKMSKVTQWPSPMSVGLSSSTTFEGIATFSGPFLQGFQKKSEKDGYFGERFYLAVLTSSGSLLFYGENVTHEGSRDKKGSKISPRVTSKRRRAFSDSALPPSHNKIIQDNTQEDAASHEQAIKSFKPKFPLTIFETLINVSNRKELRYGGDGISNEADAKKKLEIGNGEFLTSPSREGCTLTVSLQNDRSLKSTNEGGKDKTPSSALAIVAVRILLGSTSKECLPKDLNVMGRPVTVSKRMKRWYNIPLTDEEIVIGVRSGFVSIGIGGSSEWSKNSPIIDAVEVYAQERQNLPHLFPLVMGDGTLASDCENIGSIFPDSRSTLDLSILSFTHLHYLVDKIFDKDSIENRQTLLRLIQVTALDSSEQSDVREKVIDFLESVDGDEISRQQLIDEGTILGVSEMLKYIDFNSCQNSLLRSRQVVNSTHPIKEILSVLNNCMSTAISILESRPESYTESIKKLILGGKIKSSLALECKSIIDSLVPSFNVTGTVSKLMKLLLFEAMISQKPEKSPIFAGLDAISDILKYPDEKLIKECCSVIIDFFKFAPSNAQNESGTETDNPRDSAYQCDGCTAFPITGTRFTLEEGHDIDLCETCYKAGCEFARGKSASAVLINGKELRLSDRNMTCSEIRQMRPVAIANTNIEKVRQAAIPSKEITEPSQDADEDDAVLRIALKMSLETYNESKVEVSKEESSTLLREKLFEKILTDVLNSLLPSHDNLKRINQHIPVIGLLLSLILGCQSEDDRLALSEKMCKAFCKEIEILIHSCKSGNASNISKHYGQTSLVICLRSLGCLVTRRELSTRIEKDDNRGSVAEPLPSLQSTTKTRDKTDPRFVCDAHQVPAVRRR